MDRGSIPGWGAKTSHMPWGDGAHTTTKEFVLHAEISHRMQQRSHPLQLSPYTAKEKSEKKKSVHVLSFFSCVQFCEPLRTVVCRLLCPWDSLGKHTGVSCHALLQGIFLTQGLNSCFLCLMHWQMGSLPSLVSYGKPKK